MTGYLKREAYNQYLQDKIAVNSLLEKRMKEYQIGLGPSMDPEGTDTETGTAFRKNKNNERNTFNTLVSLLFQDQLDSHLFQTSYNKTLIQHFPVIFPKLQEMFKNVHKPDPRIVKRAAETLTKKTFDVEPARPRPPPNAPPLPGTPIANAAPYYDLSQESSSSARKMAPVFKENRNAEAYAINPEPKKKKKNKAPQKEDEKLNKTPGKQPGAVDMTVCQICQKEIQLSSLSSHNKSKFHLENVKRLEAFNVVREPENDLAALTGAGVKKGKGRKKQKK